MENHDIQSHQNKAKEAMIKIRNWFNGFFYVKDTLPSGLYIWDLYSKFIKRLEETCKEKRLPIPSKLEYNDFTRITYEYLVQIEHLQKEA
ncbi:Zn-finger domain associated with topoisomerase type I [Candidatus Scalindua japonica]|uniref:Zn-finger domain associated with topoisomerase type I n=1 Tax=Candidatus Scalindua japonica TaxID=1284222 RepID=A0A286TWY4_9BACT|nr:Zn-finger domain associated with topoisomerase type I [Candidatus Scalindua japonica]